MCEKDKFSHLRFDLGENPCSIQLAFVLTASDMHMSENDVTKGIPKAPIDRLLWFVNTFHINQL